MADAVEATKRSADSLFRLDNLLSNSYHTAACTSRGSAPYAHLYGRLGTEGGRGRMRLGSPLATEPMACDDTSRWRQVGRW